MSTQNIRALSQGITEGRLTLRQTHTHSDVLRALSGKHKNHAGLSARRAPRNHGAPFVSTKGIDGGCTVARSDSHSAGERAPTCLQGVRDIAKRKPGRLLERLCEILRRGGERRLSARGENENLRRFIGRGRCGI